MSWQRVLVAVTVVVAVLIPGGVAAAAPDDGAPRTRTVQYTVRPGDSLWAVGRRFGLSAQAVAKANGLRLTSVVVPGKVLVVPVPLPAGLPDHLPADLLAQPDRLVVYPLFASAAKEFKVP